MLPAGSQVIGGPVEAIRFTAALRDARRWLDAQRLRPPAHRHQHASFRAELDDHVRAFIDRPDVVLRVDADAVRHLEAVETLTDLSTNTPFWSNWKRRVSPLRVKTKMCPFEFRATPMPSPK